MKFHSLLDRVINMAFFNETFVYLILSWHNSPVQWSSFKVLSMRLHLSCNIWQTLLPRHCEKVRNLMKTFTRRESPFLLPFLPLALRTLHRLCLAIRLAYFFSQCEGTTDKCWWHHWLQLNSEPSYDESPEDAFRCDLPTRVSSR